jgi:tRNA(fMet)-specific endonuclease VapC
MSAAKVLLDTNVVSYIMKGYPLAEAYFPYIKDALIAISFITVGEMYYGAEHAGWGEAKRKRLETELRNYIVVPYDHEIARCYGRLVAGRRRGGKPIDPNDAWIAACAARHSVPLITHNARHFEGISSLELISATTQ